MALSQLCAPKPFPAFRNPAVIVGHPGHELKVFGWISRFRPRVYVMTDGSGHQGESRLASTARVLAPLAIDTDKIFGLISDADLYRAILAGRISWFLAAVDLIAESFIANNIDCALADAMEGFNPAHDLCRTLVDAAVVVVNRETSRTLANYEFSLTEWERGRQAHHDSRCWHFALDDDTLCGKIKAAREYTELKDEVREALALRGTEYFRIECLRQVTQPFQPWDDSARPDYETCGELRVAEGAYQSVIRYDEHIVPIVAAIRRHATASKASATVPRSYSPGKQPGRETLWNSH
jgi:hypothetical protein